MLSRESTPCVLPPHETERLEALASYDAVEAPTERGLEDLTDLAAKVAGTAFASIMLLDAQTAWLKATTTEAPCSLDRQDTVCSHTILQPGEPLVIPDLMGDPRFQNSPFLLKHGFRAYAGIPLLSSNGHAIGALCVLDQKSRPFSDTTIDTLSALSRAVMTHLELRRALKRADLAALTDPLTGLPNRRTAIQAIEKLTVADRPFTAIMIDLDFFKEVNDSAGHAAGDAVLRAVSSRLQAAVRPEDTVARLGGDEFVLLLPNVGDRPAAALVAERVCANLHVPLDFAGKQHRVGATLGVAQYPADVSEGRQVIRLADEALMRAKREKRGSIGFAAPGDAQELKRATAIIHAFEGSADRASAPGLVSVLFQPIVTLSRDSTPQRLRAVEALVRWSHPAVGEVMPDKLFALIGPERAISFGRTIRAAALSSFGTLCRAGLGEARLAINLSAREAMRTDTAPVITDQVESAGLSLSQIEIEITEDVLLERVSNKTLDQLAALRGRGARLILDDFGAGTSGLAQMLRLPIDGLKLGKQFVHRLGIDRRAEEIVKATISLAHSLSIDLVAEGIETQSQAEILSRFGCTQAQGNLFGRPMPEQAMTIWLQNRSFADRDVPLLPQKQKAVAAKVSRPFARPSLRGAVEANSA